MLTLKNIFQKIKLKAFVLFSLIAESGYSGVHVLELEGEVQNLKLGSGIHLKWMIGSKGARLKIADKKIKKFLAEENI